MRRPSPGSTASSAIGTTGATSAAKVGVKDWPEQTRKDFLEFVRKRAWLRGRACRRRDVSSTGRSSRNSSAARGARHTGHGPIHAFEVKFADSDASDHQGLAPFTTTDELWHRMATQPEKKILATAFSAKDDGGSGQDEPVAMTTEFGRGRCFNLVLGHDVAAMENAGFQTLLVRGVEWAATGKVTPYRQAGPAIAERRRSAIGQPAQGLWPNTSSATIAPACSPPSD